MNREFLFKDFQLINKTYQKLIQKLFKFYNSTNVF